MRRYINVVILVLFLVGLTFSASTEEVKEEQETIQVTDTKKRELYAGVFSSFADKIYATGVISPDLKNTYLTPEEQSELVYTFLQGPRAFNENRPWSGEWYQQVVNGNSFGGFGCGFCCMANIYSTLTDYECSPWDMFEFATQATYYYPTEESGAIGWGDLKGTLKAAGFACEVYRKPDTYKAFQKQVKEAKTAIVLVSSAEDDTFWKDTPGHYVNIWLYQERTDMVFLAEPGDPENNRSWIPLRYVYDALKTISNYQYLAVTSYSEEANTWKWNGIDEIWNGKY